MAATARSPLSRDDFCMPQSGVDAVNIIDWLLER